MGHSYQRVHYPDGCRKGKDARMRHDPPIPIPGADLAGEGIHLEFEALAVLSRPFAS